MRLDSRLKYFSGKNQGGERAHNNHQLDNVEEHLMAEYFRSFDDAMAHIREWKTKDGSVPSFFGKILNHGEEKYIVCWRSNENPSGSPFIKVLQNLTNTIR
jgi:hypothetical protein